MLDQGVSQTTARWIIHLPLKLKLKLKLIAHCVPNFAQNAPCDKPLLLVDKIIYVYRISFILASPSIKITLEKLRLIYVVNTTTVLQYNIFRKTPSVGIHTGMKIKSACYSIQLYNSPNIFTHRTGILRIRIHTYYHYGSNSWWHITA